MLKVPQVDEQATRREDCNEEIKLVFQLLKVAIEAATIFHLTQRQLNDKCKDKEDIQGNVPPESICCLRVRDDMLVHDEEGVQPNKENIEEDLKHQAWTRVAELTCSRLGNRGSRPW